MRKQLISLAQLKSWNKMNPSNDNIRIQETKGARIFANKKANAMQPFCRPARLVISVASEPSHE